MTVPGVGPMTALAYVTAIEEAHRFATSASVGAYLGLTSRRHQSADVDWSGHISKHGDGVARHMLYEAAHSLLRRVRAWSAPKAWAARLVKTVGPKKARVALARKLAVILHPIWVDGGAVRRTAAPAAKRKTESTEHTTHELRPRRDEGPGETRPYGCAPKGDPNALQGHWDARAF